MVSHFMSAFWKTIKSGFGLLGIALTALGVVGHNVEATRVNVWARVVGLSLLAVAALWELAKGVAELDQIGKAHEGNRQSMALRETEQRLSPNARRATKAADFRAGRLGKRSCRRSCESESVSFPRPASADPSPATEGAAQV